MTPWKPVGNYLPGYEWRINEEGHRETRPIKKLVEARKVAVLENRRRRYRLIATRLATDLLENLGSRLDMGAPSHEEAVERMTDTLLMRFR